MFISYYKNQKDFLLNRYDSPLHRPREGLQPLWGRISILHPPKNIALGKMTPPKEKILSSFFLSKIKSEWSISPIPLLSLEASPLVNYITMSCYLMQMFSSLFKSKGNLFAGLSISILFYLALSYYHD